MRSNSTVNRRGTALWKVAFVAGGLILTGGALPLQAMPRLVVQQPVFEFGCVTNVTQLRHAFVLRNTGDSPLQIRKLVSGCESCLILQADASTIAPGGQALVHCALDARLLDGEVVRFAQVQSNDVAGGPAELELRATLVRLYEWFPPEISLEGSPESVNGSVTIRPLIRLREPLSRVESDNTNVIAGVSEIRPGSYQVVVQALETLPRGQWAFNLTVRSAATNDPPCRIAGRINFPRDVELIPSQLVFEAREQPQSRILWVRQQAGLPVTLLDVVPSSREFQCEIVPETASFDYRIHVEAGNLALLAGQTRVLTLKARNSSQEEIQLPPVVMSICTPAQEVP
ncbi:MAG: DUF1573 domain-containing protein [bacterium]